MEGGSNHWALEQMYGELKVRYNTTEVAHDEYVSYLEEIGDSEDWLERVAQRFDELEKEIGDSKLSKGDGTRKQVGVEKRCSSGRGCKFSSLWMNGEAQSCERTTWIQTCWRHVKAQDGAGFRIRGPELKGIFIGCSG